MKGWWKQVTKQKRMGASSEHTKPKMYRYPKSGRKSKKDPRVQQQRGSFVIDWL